MGTKKHWGEDGDDAHFPDNPAVRKGRATKRAANALTKRNLHKTAKQPNVRDLNTKRRPAKTYRKRVSGK